MDFKGGVGLNLDQFVTEFRYNYNQSKIGITEGIEDQSNSKSVVLPYQDLNTHILSLHNHFFLHKSKIELNLGYIINNRKEYEDEHDQQNLAEINLAALDMQLRTLSYDLKYNFPKLEKFDIRLRHQKRGFPSGRSFGKELQIH